MDLSHLEISTSEEAVQLIQQLHKIHDLMEKDDWVGICNIILGLGGLEQFQLHDELTVHAWEEGYDCMREMVVILAESKHTPLPELFDLMLFVRKSPYGDINLESHEIVPSIAERFAILPKTTQLDQFEKMINKLKKEPNEHEYEGMADDWGSGVAWEENTRWICEVRGDGPFPYLEMDHWLKLINLERRLL